MAIRKRRNSRNQQSRIWPWITFLLFALVIALLGYSVIKKQSPVRTLKQIFSTEKDPQDLTTYSKKELLALAQDQKEQLSILSSDLEKCQEDDGLKKAVIATSYETLNMRTEATLESDILLKIPNGSRVSILYYDDENLFLEGAMGRWCYITYADQEGWVWGNYLEPIDG